MRLFLCIIVIISIHCLPFETASSSFQIRSISKYNWDIFGKNEINEGCKYDSKCVSKPAIPSRDEDCICSSCKSKWKSSNKIVLPSCDSSTCNNNACEPVYVSGNGRIRVNQQRMNNVLLSIN